MFNNSSVDNIELPNLRYFLNITERATKAGLDAVITYNIPRGATLTIRKNQNLGVADCILYLDSTEAEFDTVSEYVDRVEEEARLIKLGEVVLSKLSYEKQEAIILYVLKSYPK
jgi:hypothetical protein